MHDDEHFRVPLDTHRRGATVRILDEDWDMLTARLLGGDAEHAALLICGVAEGTGSTYFIVQEVVHLQDEDFVDRGQLHLAVAPASIARHAKRARALGAAVILVHSHPFPGLVRASSIDLETEADLCRRVLTSRTGLLSGALVLGPDGVDGRTWSAIGASPMLGIRVHGERVRRIEMTSFGVEWKRPQSADSCDRSTERQELMWGASGQRVLRDTHVVVVGCGGTGSHVVQQLAHLRVGRLTLIDADIIEESNLSRIVGSTATDVGRAKVDVLAEFGRSISPVTEIAAVQESVLDVDPAIYTGADVIVCATDGHGSRALLTEVAVQYFIPVVDLGVEVVPDGSAFQAGGGVRVLRPGQGCLWCAQTLSAARVREEYLSDAERLLEVQRGYLRNVDVPSPSVVALNGVVSSLAVLEVCQLTVGMLGSSRDRLLYRAEQRRMTATAITSRSTCHVCGTEGSRGRGGAVRVKTRWRSADEIGA